jgi:hypothetical protein
MQCKEVEAVLEQEGFAPLPELARTHIASCSACTNLVSDFSAILAIAEQLPTEVEPPARVWVSLRNQLEAEGVIRSTVELVAPGTSWWQSFTSIIRGRALATAAVGFVIAAAGIVQIQTGTQTANSSPEPFAETAMTLNQEEQNLSIVQPAAFSVVDTSLRQNLDSLNQFIADCRKRVKEDPQDDLAREYLSGAYQQKAELLSAMLDRGGSTN